MKVSSLIWGIKEVENWFETALFAGGLVKKSRHQMRFRNGMKLTLRHTEMEFLAELMKRDCYRLKSGFLPKSGSVVLDVGANVGIFTVIAALSGAAHVYAVEPEKDNLSLLRENVFQNGLNNVTIIDKAIGPKRGEADLHLQADGSGAHTIRRSADVIKYTGARQKVEVITMEDLIGDIERVGLLKFDAEGIEHEVMEAMAPEMAGKIERIVMESHKRGIANEYTLARKLAGLGYRVSIDKIDAPHAYVFANRNRFKAE